MNDNLTNIFFNTLNIGFNTSEINLLYILPIFILISLFFLFNINNNSNTIELENFALNKPQKQYKFKNLYNFKEDTYYFFLMTQEDFYKNKEFEEVIREKTSVSLSFNNDIDFWIVNEPDIIEIKDIKKSIFSYSWYIRSVFQNKLKTNKDTYFSCFITTNKRLYDWLTLRIGEFEYLDRLNSSNLKIKYSSDGIRGEFSLQNDIELIKKLFSNNSELLSSDYLPSISKKLKNNKKNKFFRKPANHISRYIDIIDNSIIEQKDILNLFNNSKELLNK